MSGCPPAWVEDGMTKNFLIGEPAWAVPTATIKNSPKGSNTARSLAHRCIVCPSLPRLTIAPPPVVVACPVATMAMGPPLSMRPAHPLTGAIPEVPAAAGASVADYPGGRRRRARVTVALVGRHARLQG